MAVDKTYDRIVAVAMNAMVTDGVKKLSLGDVAYQAGITRVTIYRYFGNKQGLFRAVCLHIASYFQKAADGGADDSMQVVNSRLHQLGSDLRQLPPGNLLARIDEIGKLYPDVYREFRALRQNAIDRLFQQALTAATREHALRDGLNMQVVKAIFLASVIRLIEDPALISSNVSLGELFSTVTEVFRHGILKGADEEAVA